MAKSKKPPPESLLTPAERKEIENCLPDDLPEFVGRVEAVGQMPFSWGYSPWVWLGVTALCLAWVVAIPVILAVRPPAGDDADSERTAAYVALGIFGVFSLMGLVVLTVLLTRAKYRRGEHWVFCRGALVRLKWGRATVFPWKALEVRKTNANPFSTRYELTGHGGKPVVLRFGLPTGRVLPHAIQGRHCDMVRPALEAKVQAGEEVVFGKVGVSKSGFRHKKKVAAWGDVEKLEVGSDKAKPNTVRLAVRAGRGSWEANLSEEVPNAWLMLELVSTIEPGLVKKKWNEFHDQVA